MRIRVILLAFSLLFSVPAIEANGEVKTAEKSESIEVLLSDIFCSETRKSKEFPRLYSNPANFPVSISESATFNKPVVIIFDRIVTHRRLLI